MEVITKSIVLNTDSYKFSQFNQYPSGTEFVNSYIESRGGEFESCLFFGLQMFIKEYLMRPVTKAEVDMAERISLLHNGSFYREGWDYIVDVHGGKLPVEIEAVREGTILATGNVLVQIINTDPKCWWLVSFLETALLRGVWYPTTVASNSLKSKKIISKFLEETSDNMGALAFMLHDFGARGATSFEACGIGGLAHLINFLGTDNMTALLYGEAMYGANITETGIAWSVPAMEHSTVTSWGREGEMDSYRNMFDTYGKPGKIFSAVSDSYDIEQACHMWGSMRDDIVASGSKLVVRPDSGNPVDVSLQCLDILASYYGVTVNSKGYKVLNNVGVLYGDGINHTSIGDILNALKERGYSAENMVFGQGGALLQSINRDTMKFAMKCSAARVKGEWIDVYKDPITDSGKRSKRGRLALVDVDGVPTTVRIEDIAGRVNLLEPVFRNGELLRDASFDEIRKLAA